MSDTLHPVNCVAGIPSPCKEGIRHKDRLQFGKPAYSFHDVAGVWAGSGSRIVGHAKIVAHLLRCSTDKSRQVVASSTAQEHEPPLPRSWTHPHCLRRTC